MVSKKKKRMLTIVGLLICITGIAFFNRYSEKILIEEINIDSNKYPLIVCKTDVDEHHNFKRVTSEISNKEDKEKIIDYLEKKQIKRIIVFLEPFFNPEFDLKRFVPRYSFDGCMRDFEIWGNQYICIHIDNRNVYYKFIDELNTYEFEEMLELKEIKN